MNKSITGVAGLVFVLTGAKESEKIPVEDIPEICRNYIEEHGHFGENHQEINAYTTTDGSSVSPDGVFSFERRIWSNPRPSFADNARMECRWTTNGEITYTYEEPSPRERPEDYYGQNSLIFSQYTFSADQKTLLYQESAVRYFGEEFNGIYPMVQDIRAGKYPFIKEEGHYISAVIKTEEIDPQTGGLLLVAFGKKHPVGKLKLYVTSQLHGEENGMKRRIVEVLSMDDRLLQGVAEQRYHVAYVLDHDDNVVRIERDDYDYTGNPASPFGLERTRSKTREFTYTHFRGGAVFATEVITYKNPKTRACIGKVAVKYEYGDPNDNSPPYWRTVEKLDCGKKVPPFNNSTRSGPHNFYQDITLLTMDSYMHNKVLTLPHGMHPE